MKELKCPKCGNAFVVDEADYASILSQVKNAEFQEEVERRMEEFHRQQRAEQKADALKAEMSFQEKLNAKDIALNQKDAEIARLREQVTSAVRAKENELNVSLANKEQEIVSLKSTITQAESKLRIALLEEQNKAKTAMNAKEAEIAELRVQAKAEQVEASAREMNLKNQYEGMLKQAQAEVDLYKNMKARMSTKMVGESLEIHCNTEFNRMRTMMYPYAYFEKDNDVREGSKGDFIFRDFDEEGVEYISIMFEMKNECDQTATKHKNEDFFAKLDKDRRAKGCEYAVLVSLLEPESDFYNDGIVDVSYKYPKMYVVRPQFFLPIITLLSNAARNSADYKRQLIIERNNNLDITHFEENMEEFKKAFGRNYDLASKKFAEAIEDIDKTIRDLEKTKAALLSSENNLRLANNKAQDLSIKRLTRNAPSVREKFDEIRAENGGDDGTV